MKYVNKMYYDFILQKQLLYRNYVSYTLIMSVIDVIESEGHWSINNDSQNGLKQVLTKKLFKNSKNGKYKNKFIEIYLMSNFFFKTLHADFFIIQIFLLV